MERSNMHKKRAKNISSCQIPCFPSAQEFYQGIWINFYRHTYSMYVCVRTAVRQGSLTNYSAQPDSYYMHVITRIELAVSTDNTAILVSTY